MQSPEFAPDVEVKKRQVEVGRFVQEVLGLPWAFIEEINQRVQVVYAKRLEAEHFDMPLYLVVDRLVEPFN